MPIFERVNKKLSFTYSKRESVISIELEITDKWIFYSSHENVVYSFRDCGVLNDLSKELCRKRSATFQDFFVPVREIVYLFKKQL